MKILIIVASLIFSAHSAAMVFFAPLRQADIPEYWMRFWGGVIVAVVIFFWQKK